MKDDNPFGTESSGTDPFGRPTSDSADAFGTPPEASTPPTASDAWRTSPEAPPTADDGWRTSPAPPPSGQYTAPSTPGRKADGATASLVLGIIGVLLCFICAPFAWSLGRKAERAVDASGGALGGRGEATAGKILGMIGTGLMVIGIIVFIALIAIGASTVDSGGGTTTTFEF